MSGREMLHFGRVDKVNINGTCHVLEACADMGVSRLVYVSTYNVVFGGKEIVNGDESLPYFPIDEHVDSYGHSKSIAEQMVLKSNGRPLKKKKKGKRLYTCAVRPAAIYGPGEERHLPRIVLLAKLGLFPFKTGEPSVKSNWIYIDNLVLALVLASMGLLDDIPGSEGNPVAAGQPYFVSDVEDLFVKLPKRVHVGVTHYFSFLKARQELGYVPMVTPREGMAATIAYWQDRKRKSLDGPTIHTWLLAVIGMISIIAAAYFAEIGPVRPLKALSVFLFRSMWMVRLVWVLALAAHVGDVRFRAQRKQ